MPQFASDAFRPFALDPADTVRAGMARPATPSLASARLERVGVAMYGPRWQTDLARDLGIADRTIRRYATGVVAVPDGFWTHLAKVVRRRRDGMDAALHDLADEAPVARATVEGYLSEHAKAVAAERRPLELAQWALMPDADRAYLEEHRNEIRVRTLVSSGPDILLADSAADPDVIDRVTAIVSASSEATLSAGGEPAWVSAIQAKMAIDP